MLLPARSPTPQVLPEPLGVSVNFLSKEGVLSSSNILRVWNNQLKEIRAPRKACKSRLQRILPSERTQRLQGQHTWEKQSQDAGSWQKWLCKRGLYKTGPQGPPGEHPRPEGERPPWSQQKQEGEDPPRGKTGHEKADQLTSLHTHRQHTYLPVLNQASAQ